jgi:hypothetical protein
LKRVSHLKGWVSPRLGIRFVLTPDTLEIYDPEGRPFLSSVELARLAKAAVARAEQETARAEQEAARAEREARRAAEERLRAERLAERLRALGLDPNHLED